MVEFYLLTFPRFPLRKKEHKSYFGKNRTHDFRTSRCAAYLLDHSGDERLLYLVIVVCTVCPSRNQATVLLRYLLCPGQQFIGGAVSDSTVVVLLIVNS